MYRGVYILNIFLTKIGYDMTRLEIYNNSTFQTSFPRELNPKNNKGQSSAARASNSMGL